MIKDDAYKWLNDNANMYRGNNASDCMVAAFIAGAKLVEEKFTSTNKQSVPCGDCGMLLPSNMECDNTECVRVIIQHTTGKVIP